MMLTKYIGVKRQAGTLHQSREVSSIDLRCFLMTFLAVGSVEADSLLR